MLCNDSCTCRAGASRARRHAAHRVVVVAARLRWRAVRAPRGRRRPGAGAAVAATRVGAAVHRRRRRRPTVATRRVVDSATLCLMNRDPRRPPAAPRCAPTPRSGDRVRPGARHGARPLLRRPEPLGADAARAHHGLELRWRTRATLRLTRRRTSAGAPGPRDARPDRQRVDGLAAAPRDHPHRRLPRRRRRRRPVGARPARLGAGTAAPTPSSSARAR